MYTFRESKLEILSSDEDDVDMKNGVNLSVNKPTKDQDERYVILMHCEQCSI